MRKIKKWFRLNRLYDINYSDQILRSLVKTTYAKKKLNILSLMIVTIIARLHIDAILGLILSTGHVYIDFWIQILISVALVIKGGWIYQIVEKFDREVYSITRYLVNNYSDDNYRTWKRYVTFVICFYLMAYLSVVEVSSQVLKVGILQYLICYIIVEIIEKRYQMYDHFYLVFNPHVPTFIYTDELEIVQPNPLILPDSNSKKNAVYVSPLPVLRKSIRSEPLLFTLDDQKDTVETDLTLRRDLDKKQTSSVATELSPVATELSPSPPVSPKQSTIPTKSPPKNTSQFTCGDEFEFKLLGTN